MSREILERKRGERPRDKKKKRRTGIKVKR